MITLLSALVFAEPVILDADSIVWEDGVVRGSGHVTLSSGPDRVEASGFAIDLQTRVAAVEAGTWRREDVGVLEFTSAEIRLDGSGGLVRDGAFQGDDGKPRLEGAVIEIAAGGVVSGEALRWTDCDCDRPAPWSVTARHAELTVGRELRFRGGWVRFFEVPVVPVPGGRVPLSRRSGLLAPDLRYGQDGFRAALPVYLTLGPSADLTLTPEVRTRRSARVLSEVRWAMRGGRGHAAGVAGWDGVEEAWRGGGSVDHASVHGPLGIAANGTLVTDLTYPRTYGDSFLARAPRFGELRAVAGTGTVEGGTRLFQDTVAAAQDLWLTATVPQALPGGLLADAAATAGVRVRGTDPWNASKPALFGAFHAAIERATRVGPLVLTPRLATAGAGELGAAHGLGGRLTTEVRLPMWRDARAGFERLDLIIDGGAVADPGRTSSPIGEHVAAGVLWRRNAKVTVETRLSAGRTHGLWSSQAVAFLAGRGGGARIELTGTHDTITTFGAANLRLWASGAWGSLSLLELLATPDAVPIDGWFAQDHATATLAVPFTRQTLRVLGGVGIDRSGTDVLRAPTWQSRWVGLRYDHPGRCLRLDLRARFDTDRTLPDLQVMVDLFPSGP